MKMALDSKELAYLLASEQLWEVGESLSQVERTVGERVASPKGQNFAPLALRSGEAENSAA